MSRISLCMIVRNEEESLPRAVRSVEGLADEIVVVDTGSTDRTVEVAVSLGAKVGRFEWCDDFAAARNRSLELAGGEWIMVLDADDEFERADIPLARERLAATTRDGLTAHQSVVYPNGSSMDKGQLVLFRNRPDFRYRFRIHERISIDPARVECTALRLRHHGYTAELMPAKFKRNERLLMLMKRDPDPLARAAAAYYLGWQYDYEGRLQEAHREYYEAAHCGLACEYRLYAVLHLARLCMRRGEVAFASDLYARILESNPKAIEPCLELAEIFLRGGRRAEAKVLYERAIISDLRVLPQVDRRGEDALRAHLARGLGYTPRIVP